MIRLRNSIFLMLQFIVFSNVFAQTSPTMEESRKYQDCISKVEISPYSTLTLARDWYIAGGGVAAQHCEAIALYELDEFKDAATLFERIVEKLIQKEGVSQFAEANKETLKVQLNYLAGNAWREAGDLDRAYNAFSAAIIGLAPNSVFAYDAYIERGIVLDLKKDYRNAVDDFTRAMELKQENIDGFIYRAKSFRKMHAFTEARLDLKVALEMDAYNPGALFESGIVFRLQNKKSDARFEWLKLIDKHPNTHWQKLAEDNIDLMDQ
jgi:tetratricopeptide (TPR) repeat protein